MAEEKEYIQIKSPQHAVEVIEFMAEKFKVNFEEHKDSPSYSRVAWLALSELAAQWRAGPGGIRGEQNRTGAEEKMDNVVECVAAELIEEAAKLGKVQGFEVPLE